MNPSNTDNVITEMGVKNTTPSSGSSDSDRDYSWNHVEIEDKKVTKEEPKVESKEEPKVESKDELKEEPKVDSEEPKEEPKVESKDELKEEPKVESKESSIPDQTDSSNASSDDDMPPLVEDSDDMPPLVEDSDDDMPELVSDHSDQIMMAVFSKPDCPRCEAAMKILMGHTDNTPDNSDIELSEHSDSDSDSESDDEEDEKNSGVPAVIGGLFIIYLILQIVDLINRLSGRSIQYCRPF